MLGEWPGSQEGTQPANYVAVEARAIAAFLREAAEYVSNDDRRLSEAIVRKLTRPDPRSTETPRLVRLLNVLIDLKRGAISFAGDDDVLAATRSAIALVTEVACRCKEPPHKSAQPDPDGVFRPNRQTGLYHLSAEQLGSQMRASAAVLARFAGEAEPQAKPGDQSTGGEPSVRDGGDSQPDRFAELREWTVATLRKAERATLELLTNERTNATSLANLALKLDWQGHGPHDDQAGSLRRRINKKLRDGRQPWKIVRHDNEFRLQSAEQGSQRTNATKRRRAPKKNS